MNLLSKEINTISRIQINNDQKLFIENIIEHNLDEYMLAFWLNSWFDLYRAKQILFTNLAKILLDLKQMVSATFGSYWVSWNYEHITNLPEVKLWLVEFDLLNRYESLEEALMSRVLDDRKWLNYISLVVDNILSWDIGLPKIEHDINIWKTKYIFSFPYKITDKWTWLLDGFLSYEWKSVNLLVSNASKARQSIAELNPRRTY